MTKTLEQKNRRVLIPLLFILLGMWMLAFASVPLYRAFCKVTGFGGTVKLSESLPTRISERKITVRFNADINPELPWTFTPLQTSVEVHAGEVGLAYYEVENKSPEPLVGIAIYNVTPLKAGKYFNKVECFCFEDQLLNPHQKTTLPVTFFIDPDIDKDPNQKDVKAITLSYTFYKSNNQEIAQKLKRINETKGKKGANNP